MRRSAGSSSTRSLGSCLALAVGCLTACGGSPSDTDGGNDAGTTDATVTCAVDVECDDGSYCNGPERCMPGAVGASTAGCVAAASPPCDTDETCQEAADTCTPGCTDDDGDGHSAPPCGDDCDDGDALRYPGNTEVCDAVGLDDDCNPATLGADADSDGFADSACCNRQPDLGLYCGGDCNDTEANVHPGAPESCNAVDDNCNTTIDEGVVTSYYRDCDSDGFGATTGSVQGCTFPVGAPDCGGRAGVWLPTPGDCDDTTFVIHGGAQDVCDELDNDCDGTIDGAPAEAWCSDGRSVHAVAPSCAAGVCVPTSCVAPYRDCTSAPGCESDPLSDPRHCGGCANTCAHPTCTLGQCVRDAIQLVVGGEHACILRGDGTVACWGQNSNGEIGDGTTLARRQPTTVVGLSDAVAIGAGGRHTCAMLLGERVVCWGDNSSGQLGDGTLISRSTPVDAIAPTNVAFMAPVIGIGTMALGSLHSCAPGFDASTGTYGVYCWGANSRGQLGRGVAGSAQPLPARVVGSGTDRFLAAGDVHSCSATSDGTRIRCWGGNDYGQLGDGTTVDRPTPVAPIGVSGLVASLGAGGAHSCLSGSGSVSCWGRNDRGQLGDGTTTERHAPAPVSTLTYAWSLDGGPSVTCGTGFAGVSCWGANDFGQLGDGSTVDRTSPVVVAGIAADPVVPSAATGGSFFQASCALIAGGVSCWGSNWEGLLGRAPADSTTPVALYDP